MSARGLRTAGVLVAIACGIGAPAALDARVIMRPTIPSACPGGNSWDKVAACLARWGNVRVVRSAATYKVVILTHDERKPASFRVPGLYLYTAAGKRWRIGGAFEGHDIKLEQIRSVKMSSYHGYRIDLVSQQDVAVSIGEHPRAARVRYRFATFCSGGEPHCTNAVRACDVFVGGKSYWTFRGTLEIRGDTVHVRGDRSKAGDYCSAEEEVLLPGPPAPSHD